MTGTYAGQFVMEGFLAIKVRPWIRNLITRSVAIVPSLVVALIAEEKGSDELIVLSQVLLSIQLPFALLPLIKLTSNAERMGQFKSKLWMSAGAGVLAGGIIIANFFVVYAQCEKFLSFSSPGYVLLSVGAFVIILAYMGLLCVVAYMPLAKTQPVSYSSILPEEGVELTVFLPTLEELASSESVGEREAPPPEEMKEE